MKKILSLLLASTLVLSLITGCGSTSANGGAASPPASVSGTASTESTVNSAAKTAVWPRTITDAVGNKVTLKEQPRRIALLHTFYLEHFLALGTAPTACAVGNVLGQSAPLADSELFAPYIKNAEIVDLGSARTLSLEAILEAKPDLIVTFNAQGGVVSNYNQLVGIAPVVQLDYSLGWADQLRECAEIVGKEAEAENLITEIEKKIDNTKKALSAYADKTFGLFRTDGKNFITRSTASYYKTFGITAPKGWPDTYTNISLEKVAEMNPYYIVFQHNYAASVAFVEGMKSSSVWRSLDAVQNGRVYYFDENMNTFGPLAMDLTADKLIKIYTSK